MEAPRLVPEAAPASVLPAAAAAALEAAHPGSNTVAAGCWASSCSPPAGGGAAATTAAPAAAVGWATMAILLSFSSKILFSAKATVLPVSSEPATVLPPRTSAGHSSTGRPWPCQVPTTAGRPAKVASVRTEGLLLTVARHRAKRKRPKPRTSAERGPPELNGYRRLKPRRT